MARIQESVEIKRPADKVFAFTTDAKSWPKWHPGSHGVRQFKPFSN